MVTYKNIRIKKKGGGTRLQRVKVLASGKYKFVKNIKKSKSRSTKKTKTTKRKSNPTKKGGNRRMGKSLQTSIFKLARAGALLAPAAFVAVGGGTAKDKISEISRRYTGVNLKTGQFEPHYLAQGYTPFLATCAVTYLIPKLNGIIRKI